MSLMRRLVGGKQTSGGSESSSVARIVKELESLDESTAYFLASFAYVLARVAAADLDVDPAEEEAMYRILLESTELDAEHARLVTQIAREQAAEEGGTENYLATREFREHSSREQQVRLLRALLQVAAADGHVSETETNEIASIAEEIGFSPAEVKGLRADVRRQAATVNEAGKSE
jgi:uncharacterized tellurite resistance protein B-like protein